MNDIVKYDRLNEILKYKAKDLFPFLSGVFFLCGDFIKAIFRFLIPFFVGRENLINGIMDTSLIILITCSYLSIYKSLRKKIKIWPIYVIAFGFIAWSILFHPEYSMWFKHNEYGLDITIFHLTCAIFGLLIFSLYRNKTKMVTVLLYGCRLNLLFHIYQYADFLQRGYWEAYLGDGTLVRLSYGLNYGYVVTICVIFFLAMFVFNHKWIDLVSFIVSFFLVITAGSRGPLVSIAFSVLFLYLFVWKNSAKKSLRYYFMLFLLVTGLITVVTALPLLVNGLTVLLRRTNISGRVIEMLLNGNISDDSGRSVIYQIAFDMIKEGGLLGYGFYGDRYIIGRTWHFGYPHNIFLELLIQFGPLVGGIIIGALIYNIIRMFVLCKDKAWQLLFVTMFCSSIKLWLSDSFWYFWPFWGLLAVLGLWNKEQGYSFSRYIRLKKISLMNRRR